jgi:hypothetical protein
MSTCVSNVYVCQQPMACTICSIAEERECVSELFPAHGWMGAPWSATAGVHRGVSALQTAGCIWADTRAPARIYGHARDRHTHNESGALVWAELGLSSVCRVKVLL